MPKRKWSSDFENAWQWLLLNTDQLITFVPKILTTRLINILLKREKEKYRKDETFISRMLQLQMIEDKIYQQNWGLIEKTFKSGTNIRIRIRPRTGYHTEHGGDDYEEGPWCKWMIVTIVDPDLCIENRRFYYRNIAIELPKLSVQAFFFGPEAPDGCLYPIDEDDKKRRIVFSAQNWFSLSCHPYVGYRFERRTGGMSVQFIYNALWYFQQPALLEKLPIALVDIILLYLE
jgi:hypothetical protein